ncbi:MAG: rhodanese-like domain-containing protein [Egibacteraceae bacterium]
MIEELEPRQVAERLCGSDPPLLVDVREPWEHQTAAIGGARHIPLGALPSRVDELPRDRPIVLHCHHGGRSMQAARWLELNGYPRLVNMNGGIDAWSQTVDETVPRYT